MQPVPSTLFNNVRSAICVQMCILDGNAYDAKCLEAGQEREEDLDGCSLLLNNKVQFRSRLLFHFAIASCCHTCMLRVNKVNMHVKHVAVSSQCCNL